MNILSRHPKSQHPAARFQYEIVVEGRFGSRWAHWFEGFDVVDGENSSTKLIGWVDQAALHAALTRIRDLGVPLIGVRRLTTVATPDAREA